MEFWIWILFLLFTALSPSSLVCTPSLYGVWKSLTRSHPRLSDTSTLSSTTRISLLGRLDSGFLGWVLCVCDPSLNLAGMKTGWRARKLSFCCVCATQNNIYLTYATLIHISIWVIRVAFIKHSNAHKEKTLLWWLWRLSSVCIDSVCVL